MRYLFLIFFIYFLAFGLMGLLFNLHWGLPFGLMLALVIFLIISFWGEKIILIFAKARYITDDAILINQVKNLCCHNELPEIKLYWSNVFVNNFYYTNSYFGKPSLIIGSNLYKMFTRKELNGLIYASILKLKSSEAKHRTVAGLLFLILYSPVYILRSLAGNKSNNSVLNIFLYPAYFLKSKLYENEELVFSFDQKVGKMDGLKKDYISALFKVNHLPACSENSIGGLLVNELSHVRNQTGDIFNYLFIEHVSVDARVKALK